MNNRMKPQYIFTIDTDALKRAGYPQEEVDRIEKRQAKTLLPDFSEQYQPSTKPKPFMNLRERLRQRWK